MSGKRERLLAHAYFTFASWLAIGQVFGITVGYAVAASFIKFTDVRGEGAAALAIMLLGLLMGSMVGLVVAQNSYWPPKLLGKIFNGPRMTKTVAAAIAALPATVLGHMASQICVGIPLSAAGCRTLGFCTGLFIWWRLWRDTAIRMRIQERIATVV